jgi:hypothetical protein
MSGTWAPPVCRAPRAEKQQREPLEIGGKVLFYPDFALRTAGGDVNVAAPWKSYVLQGLELISGQNPFSDEALLKLLIPALNENKKWRSWLPLQCLLLARNVTSRRRNHTSGVGG